MVHANKGLLSKYERFGRPPKRHALNLHDLKCDGDCLTSLELVQTFLCKGIKSTEGFSRRLKS